MPRTGVRPPTPEAVKALCCECCAEYADGRYVDCEIHGCPIYCKMPYRRLEPDYMWIFGKWRSTHNKKRLALGLSKEDYINQYIIRPNGKNSLGYTALFRAKCYRCCGDFKDGRVDCEIPSCPIYYWMPYRELEPDLNWLFDLPYTRKHRDRMKFEKLTREEYIEMYIAKQIEEEEVKPIKVRTLA